MEESVVFLLFIQLRKCTQKQAADLKDRQTMLLVYFLFFFEKV